MGLCRPNAFSTFFAIKIIPHLIFRYPYFRCCNMLHNRRYNFTVIPFMWFMPFFNPKAAVLLIQPIADFLFLALLQMAKLLVRAQELTVYFLMVFCPRGYRPHLLREIAELLLSASAQGFVVNPRQ